MTPKTEKPKGSSLWSSKPEDWIQPDIGTKEEVEKALANMTEKPRGNCNNCTALEWIDDDSETSNNSGFVCNYRTYPGKWEEKRNLVQLQDSKYREKSKVCFQSKESELTENNIDEKWTSVFVPYETYQVSSLGRIKNAKGKLLTPQTTKFGYKDIGLYKDNKEKRFFVHRIVACSFLGFNELLVNHKNAIKTDNRLENLEFVTHKENTAHAIESGLISWTGETNKNSKLKEKDVFEIVEMLNKGMTPKEIASHFKIGRETIYGIRSGKCWKHLKATELLKEKVPHG